jgi:hypothetical protein
LATAHRGVLQEITVRQAGFVCRPRWAVANGGGFVFLSRDFVDDGQPEVDSEKSSGRCEIGLSFLSCWLWHKFQ